MATTQYVGKKISELPSLPSAPLLTDVFAEVQPASGGITYKVTFQQLLTLYLGNLGLINPVNGGTGVSSPTLNTLPVAQGADAFQFLGPLTNGQILIGSTGQLPIAANLTAGTGVEITNNSGSITISASGATSGFTEVTGTTLTIAADNGYVTNNAALVTLTLPTIAAFGTYIAVIGKGAGGWKVAQNTGQTIIIGSSTTTSGTGGSIASTQRYDSIYLTCTEANNVWTCLGAPQSGGITII